MARSAATKRRAPHPLRQIFFLAQDYPVSLGTLLVSFKERFAALLRYYTHNLIAYATMSGAKVTSFADNNVVSTEARILLFWSLELKANSFVLFYPNLGAAGPPLRPNLGGSGILGVPAEQT